MKTQNVIPLVLLLILSLSISRAQPPALPEGWGLVWSDEFTGTTLDATKWEHAPEWNRRGNQWWSNQDAYLDGTNNLVLRMRRNSGSIYAGAIRTRRNWPFDNQILFERTYGYFEIRTTFPVIPHGWGAFWMMPSADNPYGVTNGSQGTEIDIFETIHSTKGWINHAIYWGAYGASKDVTDMPGLYGGGYHTVGLLWTEEEYRFYVDGVETWRTTANDGVMRVPAYLKITMEANPGTYDYLDEPITMLVDYVRVYAPVPPAPEINREHRD